MGAFGYLYVADAIRFYEPLPDSVTSYRDW